MASLPAAQPTATGSNISGNPPFRQPGTSWKPNLLFANFHHPAVEETSHRRRPLLSCPHVQCDHRLLLCLLLPPSQLFQIFSFCMQPTISYCNGRQLVGGSLWFDCRRATASSSIFPSTRQRQRHLSAHPITPYYFSWPSQLHPAGS